MTLISESRVSERGGLYVHIPFCRRKCLYCDFFSGGVSAAHWSNFTHNLVAEMKFRQSEIDNTLRTVYIGGGTPSLMPPDLLSYLVNSIRDTFDCSEVKEFTIEVNPEDVTNSNVAMWKKLGVNRVSMGVQSLTDSELSFLQRNHSAKTAIKSASIIVNEFEEVSFDIIYGIPGQTAGTLSKTLEKLLELRPTHFSAYSLMYEEGTPLTKLRDIGRIRELPENIVLDFYEIVTDYLGKNGYEHYEVSNYALPGHRSLHNTSYWDFHPYLGIGPSAHSYDGNNARRGNSPDLKTYLSLPLCNEPKDFPHFVESLSEEERLMEYIMLRLRTCEGIKLETFRSLFGEIELSNLLKKGEKFLSSDMLQITEVNMTLTETGVMQSDGIIRELI